MEIPKVFVISPKEIVLRRTATEKHLKEVGLSPIFFSGLYGNDVKLISGYNNPNRNFARYRDQTPNLLCCSLNHWILWQHVLMADIPAAIIFEDDVILPSNFLEYFDGMMAQTPNDWEMIYMSILYPNRIEEGKLGADKVSDNVFKFRKSNTWDGTCDGLHAYVISQSAAKKFAGLRLTLDESMDRWISFNGLPLVNTYIWNPSPVTQHSERTGKSGPAPEGFNTLVHRNEVEWAEYVQNWK
jgi:GR25 family glycosyltransferase involved in LPS biosynthesis